MAAEECIQFTGSPAKKKKMVSDWPVIQLVGQCGTHGGMDVGDKFVHIGIVCF